MSSPRAIAYLNTEYPSLSHTFIEREIRAVRANGVTIHTFSVRPPHSTGVLGEHHAAAAAETINLHTGVLMLVVGVLLALVHAPLALWRTLIAAWRLSPPGFANRLRHFAYAAEAVQLVHHMHAADLQHVHVHMANNGAAVALLATHLDRNISYSLSIHGSAEFFHVDTWTLRPKVENALFVRCISNFCRAQVMAWCDPRVWDRLHVVHCGIDTQQYQSLSRTESRRLRLLTVGRLHPIKGYPLLLKACRQLSDEGLDWSLDMVGDGPERQRLQQLVQDLELTVQVNFSGPVGQDEIGQHFADSDVLVISSFMEGIPVVLMEAMATNMPVLATRVGGIPELVADDESGVLVDPGAAGPLAFGLRKLFERHADFTTMGSLGRSKVETEFNIDQVGQAMATLIRRYVFNESDTPTTSLRSEATARSDAVLANPQDH